MWLINWALPELAVAWRKYRIWNLVRDKRFHPDVDSDEAFAQENVSEKDGQVLGCLSVSVEHACEIARPMTHERNHLTNLETHVIVQNKTKKSCQVGSLFGDEMFKHSYQVRVLHWRSFPRHAWSHRGEQTKPQMFECQEVWCNWLRDRHSRGFPNCPNQLWSHQLKSNQSWKENK